MVSPIRPTDDDARTLARSLLADARHAALGVIDPATGAPMVTRIALVPGPGAAPLSLVSELSQHTAALRQTPACSLLVGEPGAKGDPLTHPRLTVQAQAGIVPRGTPRFDDLARHYLTLQPKAKLYIGFSDFLMVEFTVAKAFLNGGFGKAYVLGPDDLTDRPA